MKTTQYIDKKNTLIGLFAFIIWMFISFVIYSSVKDEGVSEEKIIAEKKELIDSIQKYTFNEFEAYLDYKIKISKNRSELQFDPSIVDSIVKKTSKNPLNKVIITALYNLEDEARSLAKRRIKVFKNSLFKKNIKPYQIETYTASYDFLYDEYNSFDRGILLRYEFKSKIDTIIKEVSVPENKVIYTSFSRQNFVSDQDTEAYIKKLKTYLIQNPEIKIKVIGHTDNVGKAIDNKWISKQRAKSVRRYLINKGIDSKKIEAIAKGEEEPIAPNTTQNGRRINRRIEIIVY